MELDSTLLQGRALIEQTSAAHTERWGFGTAKRWVLDQDSGRIVWSFDDHVATAQAQILGSWNSRVNTFVWSWANETIQAPLCVTAEEVRAFGVEGDVPALCSSPLTINEEQVRDLMALAFVAGRCTGLFQPVDGRLCSYIAFGAVTIEESGGRTSTFDLAAP